MPVPPVGTPVRMRMNGAYGTEITAPAQIWATAATPTGEFALAGLPEVTGPDVAHVLAWIPSEGNVTAGLQLNVTQGDSLGQFQTLEATL